MTKGRNVGESDRFFFLPAIRAGQELKMCGSWFFICRTEMLHPKLDEIIETLHLPTLKQKVIMVALLVPMWRAGRH